ncbi:MAG: hypothetical protein GWP14_09315 [Actinobacteria bacterium]|nr:hypothetical protein [Actinomycetota bacterium]
MLGDVRTRLRLAVAVAITAAGFYWIVWYAVQPNALDGPVSFIYNQATVLSWSLLLMTAAISTVLTILICRRRLPDLPVLVFTAGLCVLSVRSGPAVWVRWNHDGSGDVYLKFALEALLLTALLWSIHRLGKFMLARWAPTGHKAGQSKAKSTSASFLPAFGLAGLVAFVVIFLVTATVHTNIAGIKTYTVYSSERGQIIFAALAGGFLSTLAGHQSFRPSKSISCWLALPLVGVAGYLLLAGFGSPASEPLPNSPLGNFLPIDFVGPGVLGGMLGLLLSHKLFRNRDTQES